MSRVRRAALLGLATGVAGILLALVPSVSTLEDTLGLRWLFLARGARPAPAGVVIVSIDEAAAARLGLPSRPRDWPRSRHARLVERLTSGGAAAIAFDLEFFRDGSPADDRELAEAVAASRRVVLVQRLERVLGGTLQIWQRHDPIPALASGAAGLAPVPIPDTPLVSWFWSFLTMTDATVPTLPAVVLQVRALHLAEAFVDALRAAGFEDLPSARISGHEDLLRLMQDLRSRFRGNPSALSRAADRLATDARLALGGEELQLLRALRDLYSGSDTGYLNFYGPPGSVCTVAYEEAVADPATGPCRIEGATVFVGVGRSRVARAGHVDTYHTVYDSDDGVDISGVELHATAFANLLTGTVLRPVGAAASFALLLATGGMLGAAGYWVRTRRRRLKGAITARVQAAAVLAFLAAAYAAVAYVLFAHYEVIVPLVVPMAVQLPAALILALLVPPIVHQERVHAVCLATDGGGSTAIGQRLPHAVYAPLMRDYNRALCTPVPVRGGQPLSPHGDGFVSLWCSEAPSDDGDAANRLQACLAALEIVDAAEMFNGMQPEDRRLPVRMGLTVGSVTIHSDADRGAFEAIGDAVNVAARLQDVNRELGTQILASAEVVQGLEAELRLQSIDIPLALKGVTRVPNVFEVVATQKPDIPVTYVASGNSYR